MKGSPRCASRRRAERAHLARRDRLGLFVEHDALDVVADVAAVEAAGAELRYLPAYSPDFNPIEQFFAKLKALLRKAAARTIEALIAVIADALTTVTPNECANYLANQGYRQQL